MILQILIVFWEENKSKIKQSLIDSLITILAVVISLKLFGII